MQQVYGDNYDKGMAEQFRQASAGRRLFRSFRTSSSSMPTRCKATTAPTTPRTAWSTSTGHSPRPTPRKPPQAFVEEAGHHLDAKLNTVDTKGDEGEMFRRVLGGEQLQPAADRRDPQRRRPRLPSTVDGKQVQVEFWNPFKAIGDAAKAVGGAIADGAKAVGGAIVTGAEARRQRRRRCGQRHLATASRMSARASGVQPRTSATVLYDMTAGFLMRSSVRATSAKRSTRWCVASTARSSSPPERFVSGVMDSMQSVTNGITDALGPIGKAAALGHRPGARHRANTALDTTSLASLATCTASAPTPSTAFVGDVEALDQTGRRRPLGRRGQAIRHGVRQRARARGGQRRRHRCAGAARRGQRIAQTAVGAEPPARKLTGDERGVPPSRSTATRSTTT